MRSKRIRSAGSDSERPRAETEHGVSSNLPTAPVIACRPRPAASDESTSRRNDLDWLRVLVILFVFFYHVGMVFAGVWYIENDPASTTLHQLLRVTSFLRMPVLFFIAGAAAWFVFRRRSPGRYIVDRFRRLGIPFLVGIFLLVPVQALFIQRFETGAFPSVLRGYGEFMSTALPAVHQHWSHLWFIVYLLVASVFCLPAFMFLRTTQGEHVLQRIQRFASSLWGLLLLSVPLILIEWSMRWRWSRSIDLLNDWTNVALLITLFMYGYVLFGSDEFWDALDRYKLFIMAGGVGTMGMLFASWLILGSPSESPWQHPFSVSYTSVSTIMAVNGWLWLLAAVGYARHFLSFENGLLRYARESSYPFYLLHQPIVVAVGVYAVAMPIHPALKFGLIAAVSFALTTALYEIVVRRWNPIRFVFGLRALSQPTQSTSYSPVQASGRDSHRGSIESRLRVGQ